MHTQRLPLPGRRSVTGVALVSLLAGTLGTAPVAARAGDWWEPPAGTPPPSVQTLRDEGWGGFPQRLARVLADAEGWRLSFWSDARTLYVQAVLWEDGDDAFTTDARGRETGDYSVLSFARADRADRTPDTDRDYHLDPWPLQPGAHFVRVISADSTTTLSTETGARGAIRYLRLDDHRPVRVDSLAIPLEELGERLGGTLRLLFTWSSAVPELTRYATAKAIPMPRHRTDIPVSAYLVLNLFPAPVAGMGQPPVPRVEFPDGRMDRFLTLPPP